MRTDVPGVTLAALALAALAALPACGGDRLPLGGGGDSRCVPGVYKGSYLCTADASIFAGTSGSGDMTMTLEGDRGGPSLVIAPGTTVAGSQAGEVFASPVVGAVDCTSYRLSATAGNFEVTSAGAKVATVYEMLPMTADYDGDASPPPSSTASSYRPSFNPGSEERARGPPRSSLPGDRAGRAVSARDRR